MFTNDRVTIAGLLLAVIGLIATIIYGQSALRPPRRRLEWVFEAIPLLSSDQATWESSIEVHVDGRKVTEPYLAMLTLTNRGRFDITSESFDRQRPLVFTLQEGSKIATAQDEAQSPSVRVDGEAIFMGPDLLRSGEQWTVRFVADGRPRIVLSEDYLPNTKIVGSELEHLYQLIEKVEPREMRIRMGIAIVTLVVVFVVAEFVVRTLTQTE